MLEALGDPVAPATVRRVAVHAQIRLHDAPLPSFSVTAIIRVDGRRRRRDCSIVIVQLIVSVLRLVPGRRGRDGSRCRTPIRVVRSKCRDVLRMDFDELVKISPANRLIQFSHRPRAHHAAIIQGNEVLVRCCCFAQPRSTGPAIGEKASHGFAAMSMHDGGCEVRACHEDAPMP